MEGGVEVGEVGDDGGEGVDHGRVELGAGPVGDLLAGLVEGDGLAVGRSEVMASKASATEKTRAPAGMASPARPDG
jgi:hypothetical protein